MEKIAVIYATKTRHSHKLAEEKGCFVTSCASGKQRPEAVRKLIEEKGIEVVDEFVCKGAFLFVSVGHPNAKDLKGAADFARAVVTKDV